MEYNTKTTNKIQAIELLMEGLLEYQILFLTIANSLVSPDHFSSFILYNQN